MARRTRGAKGTKKRSRTPAGRRRAPRSARAVGAGSQVVGSVYALDDEEVERALRSGRDAAQLAEYFGEASYRELRDLAQEASAARVRGGPRVLILPGIMGSKLGRKRHFPLPDDVLWIDPIDIARGKLLGLALPGAGIEALGVIQLAYLKLKLRLKIAGYDAAFHPFDWRQSLEELGAALLERVQGEAASEVHVVAHSMGGLVARAALARPNNKKIVRFIMLGTPNFGSFAPVQALTAAHPLIRRLVAAIDAKNGPEELAERVFKTLPGLTQMLPSPERFNQVDLYDVSAWPPGPKPDAAILARARVVQDGLAEADERFFLIAGVNQRTITSVRIEKNAETGKDEFVYDETNDGDGTVPLDFARLPDTKTYYVEETHGSLPNNGRVENAVIEILANGETDRLPSRFEPSRARAVRTVRPAELRAVPFDGRRGKDVSRAELRHLLEEFVAPEASDRAFAGESPLPDEGQATDRLDFGRTDQVVVGRRRQRPLEIRLALGSITDVRTRAYVLGIFPGVDPSGAARAIDACLDGAVKEFTTRRMFSGQVGEVFAMPAGRYRLGADTVLFVGLGSFDRFGSEVLQFVAENIVRTFVRTHVEEFATVLLGAGSGASAGKSLRNHLIGFFRGLRDADPRHELRRITFCEIDPTRFQEMKEEVYRLASTTLFDDVQVTLSETELPQAVAPARPAGDRAQLRGDVVYLVVRQEPSPDHAVVYRSSVLTAGTKAAVLAGSCEVERAKLSALLQRIETSKLTFGGLPEFGRDLAALVLHDDVKKGLYEMREHHVAVVHDAPTSQIPWETLSIEDWAPAAEKGLSRRYAAENLSVAKWLEQRRHGDQLDLLLVVNPTGDLEGADQEGERIEHIFPASSRVRLHKLHGKAATRAALLSRFRSGEYDVIHYAGHAFFDKEKPSLSGIVCSDARLTGADLAGLSRLPALVVFNACEAGRIRGARRGAAQQRHAAHRRRDVRGRIARNVGLAEAFLRGGVSSYIGTYWPVGDAEASKFAETFYEALVSGESVGGAVNRGRGAVRTLKSVDWADYVHYGSPDFAIKGLPSPT